MRAYSHAYTNLNLGNISGAANFLRFLDARRVLTAVLKESVRAIDELACSRVMLSLLISKLQFFDCFGHEECFAFFH